MLKYMRMNQARQVRREQEQALDESRDKKVEAIGRRQEERRAREKEVETKKKETALDLWINTGLEAQDARRKKVWDTMAFEEPPARVPVRKGKPVERPGRMVLRDDEGFYHDVLIGEDAQDLAARARYETALDSMFQ